MTATVFTVPGLDGIEFTATYDPALSWMRLEGRDRDGDLVSASGFAVTPDPIEPIVIDPEPPVTADTEDAVTAAQDQLAPEES